MTPGYGFDAGTAIVLVLFGIGLLVGLLSILWKGVKWAIIKVYSWWYFNYRVNRVKRHAKP